MADETAAETTAAETATETAETTETEQLGDGGKKALDAERARARTAEKQARSLQKELDELRQATMSEQEKAVEAAKAAGRAEAVLESGKRLARAELRAQGSEKGLDVTALIEDVDLSKFVGDDGEPDERAIAKAVDRWAAMAPASQRPRGDVGQGVRGKPVSQDPREAFASLFQK
jgi:TolA-binding protein